MSVCSWRCFSMSETGGFRVRKRKAVWWINASFVDWFRQPWLTICMSSGTTVHVQNCLLRQGIIHSPGLDRTGVSVAGVGGGGGGGGDIASTQFLPECKVLLAIFRNGSHLMSVCHCLLHDTHLVLLSIYEVLKLLPKLKREDDRLTDNEFGASVSALLHVQELAANVGTHKHSRKMQEKAC